ncbi:MAG: DUF6398 domain-containing protein, partial [Nocardioidaceae bacterium]
MTRRDRKGKDRARRRTRPSDDSAPVPEGYVAEPEEPQDQELMRHIAAALDGRHPLELLDLVSALVSALDPRRHDPFQPPEHEHATLAETVESFMDIRLQQTSAALAVVAATTTDELLAARIRRELVARQHALPSWLRNLDFEVIRVEELTDTLGDGDDIFLGVRLPSSGHEFTILVYIDHNVGTLVKDAFTLDQPIDVVLEKIKTDLTNQDQRIDPLDAAAARVRIDDAIAQGATTFPPFESDTWPACRPLVEWVVRTLPGGGTGYQRPEWSDDDVGDLVEDFFDSEFGRPHDSAGERELLGSIIWFGTDYGPGDPLRWSPVAVEILLADWIPRKLMEEMHYLSKAPDLLRAFIRYSHARRGIRPGLTTETLEAVDRWEPGYQATIRNPRSQGPSALLDRIGAADPEAHRAMGLYADQDGFDLPAIMLHALAQTVGGQEALDGLDTRQLDDEAFDPDAIPDDIVGRVLEVVPLCDEFGDSLGDVEYRTACRRFLADVAAGDPQIFRRKGAVNRAAAAVCWVVGKTNGLFGYDGTMEVQEMLAHFGVKGSVSDRARVM